MKQFKKGDRVKVLRDFKSIGSSRNGKIGVFLGYSDMEYYPYIVDVSPDVIGLRVHDIELVKSLPEKWCIRVNKDNAKVIANWRNQRSWLPEDGYIHHPIPDNYSVSGGIKNGYHQSYKIEGYTEITFEEFQEHVLKTQILKEIEMKKIAGYKCPTSLFKGEISKGTVFKKHMADDLINEYSPNGEMLPTSYHLPAEIVESWEPVYEIVLDVEVGDYITILETGGSLSTGITHLVIGDVLKIEDIQVTSSGHVNATLGGGKAIRLYSPEDQTIYRDYRSYYRKSSKQEIEATTIVINGYKCEKIENGVKFGCQSFNKQELLTIHRLLFASELGAKLSINSEEITPDKIQTLLKLVNEG